MDFKVDFCVGDFLRLSPKYGDEKGYRLVLKVHPENGVFLTSLCLFSTARNPLSRFVRDTKDLYDKVRPSKELINFARKELEEYYMAGGLDNLTYVEVLAMLKEHEKSLTF